MKRDSLVFTALLFLLTVGLLIPTVSYPLKSRLFPSIALTTILVLVAVQLAREISAVRKAPVRKAPSTGEGRSGKGLSGQAAIWAWLAGTLIMLWVFGFMGTVFLLPFLYLRVAKAGWLISITLPLGAGLFFYTLFGWALGMPLYPGILLSRFFE